MAISSKTLAVLAIAGSLLPRTSFSLEPVILNETTTRYPLGLHLAYVAEQDASWTIDDLSSPALASRFKKSAAEVPNLGFAASPYWFCLELSSQLAEKRKLLLEVAYAELDRIDLYIERSAGGFSRITMGENFPHGNKVIRHRNFVFPLQIEPGQRKRVFLRLENKGFMQAPLVLWTAEAFLDYERESQLFFGILFGFFIVIMLYNLFLFFAIRDRSYLYHALFVMSGIILTSTHVGLAQEYLWPAHPWLSNRALLFSIYACGCFVFLFVKQFLGTRRDLPRWQKTFSALAVLYGIGFVLSLFAPYGPMLLCGFIISTATLPLLLIAPAISWRRGFVPARYYLIAWGVFILALLTVCLNKLGILPRTLFTEFSYLVGAALSIVLLSFALADRINRLRQEKDMAQARALEVQRNAAETLELQVQKRTRELEQAYDKLAEHDKLKSRFFANVSHELRTPLTLVFTPLQRLLEADQDTRLSAVREQLRTMAGNTQRLLRLVNQLLDFSRLESKVETVSYELRDARELLAPLVQGFMPFARSKGLTLELRAPDDLPQVYVDPMKLDKVLSNLLSNACKFTDSGGTVVIRLSATERMLQISVKDNGIGISEEDLPKIFERFRQVDGSAARRYEGSGIGLALSKELVELMGGRLEVESDLGLGSTFLVSLPLGKEHIQHPSLIRDETSEFSDVDGIAQARASATALAAEIGIREETTRDAAERSADSEPTGKPLLLVVDDNPDMRALVKEICKEAFRIVEAENGRRGLEQIQQQRPALVVLDVMMPEMDGYEVLRRVRSDSATSHIPVILLTAKAGPELRIEGLESGADDYLSKPFESRELLARARNLVRLQDKERELRELNARLQEEVVSQAAALQRARMLERYMSPSVAQSIMEGAQRVEVGQQRIRMTVFRLELRGFMDMVDTLDPEDMTVMLNGYLSAVMELAFAHGATVDKLIRDQVVGFFGAPTSEGPEQDALRCARMAVQIRDRAASVCSKWTDLLEGQLPVPTVVLASGHATVGNFGSARRLEYTAMGGPMDETEALLQVAEPGVAICSQSTWALINREMDCQTHGEAELVGRPRPVRLYSLAEPLEHLTDDSQHHRAATTAGASRRLAFASKVEGLAKLGSGELEEGSLLAQRYRIIGCLGEGGMGTVYQVHDLKLNSDVALKLLRVDRKADPSYLKRLYREVKLARLVNHPNMARIYDLGEWEGHEFITMEYIKGQSLDQRLKSGNALPLAEGQDIFRQLCAGLSAAHVAGFIHRDLKPANIMLEEGGRVVILDFGIARWISSLQQTETEGVSGTPHYMAPEQFDDGAVDQRADIYSLGLVAYEIFTGKRPFSSDHAVGLAYKHVHEPPPHPLTLNADLPPRLAAVILRCLEKVPQDRFGSVREISPLLGHAYVAEPGVVASPP